MDRVAVFGNAGAGKTTLSLRMGCLLGVPYHSMDKAQWKPGWVPVPEMELIRLHDVWLAGRRWIIDGWGSPQLIRQRLRRADTVVLIEHVLWRHCWWALKRQCLGMVCSRTDGPEGCPLMPRTWQLLKAIRWGYCVGMPFLRANLPEAGFAEGGFGEGVVGAPDPAAENAQPAPPGRPGEESASGREDAFGKEKAFGEGRGRVLFHLHSPREIALFVRALENGRFNSG